MSKSSTAAVRPPAPAPVINARSAWAKGPPSIINLPTNSAATSSSTTSSSTPAGTPRSQSPAPSANTPPHYAPSHSRKPSALGSAPVAMAMAVGTNVPRVGGKSQSPVTFGSIDQPTSPPLNPSRSSSNNVAAGISASMDTNPSISTKVKSFGSLPSASSPSNPSPVPAPNGSASPAPTGAPPPVATSATATIPTAGSSTSVPPSATKALRAKLDMKKLFQGGGTPTPASSSLPSSNATLPPQNASLPPQSQQQPYHHLPQGHQHQHSHASPMMNAVSIPPIQMQQHQRPPQSHQPVYGTPYSPSTSNRPLSHQSLPPPLTSNSSSSSSAGVPQNQASIPRSPSFPRQPHGLGVNGLVRPPLPSNATTPPAVGGPGSSHHPSSSTSPRHVPGNLNGTASPIPQSPRVMSQLPGTPGPGPPPGPGGMMPQPSGMMMSGMQGGQVPMMVNWNGFYQYAPYPTPDQPYIPQGQVPYGAVHHPGWLPPHMQPQHQPHLQHQQTHQPQSHPHTPQHQHQHLHPQGQQSHTPSPHLQPASAHQHPQHMGAPLMQPPPPQMNSHGPHGPQSPQPPSQHQSISSPRAPHLPPLTSPGLVSGQPASPSVTTPAVSSPVTASNPNRLSMSNLNSSVAAFVPRSNKSSAVKITDATGRALDFHVHKRDSSINISAPVASSGPASVSGSGAVTPERRGGSPAVPAVKKPVVIRMETVEDKAKRLQAEKDAAEKELLEKERLQKEEEERVRKEEEEKERLKREEEEKLRQEEEEKERVRLAEEEERIRKEKEEEEEKERTRLRLAEEEREQKRLAEEAEKERLRKIAEVEEAERERERLRLQAEKEAKEAKERQEQAKKEEEQRIAAAATAASVEKPSQSAPIENTLPPPASSQPALLAPSTGHPHTPPTPFTPSSPATPSLLPSKRRPIPGPLDLTSANRPGLPQPLPSALATARVIGNLEDVQYPEGILSPKPELNQGAKEGKFKYDREFLLQFMEVCKEKPDHLPPLDAIGIEAVDGTGPHPMHSRSTSGRRASTNVNMGPPQQPGRAAIGLGIPIQSFPKGQAFGFGIGAVRPGASAMGNVPFPQKPGIVRTSSQGGPGTVPNQPSNLGRNRERGSRRGRDRTESSRVASHAPQSNFSQQGNMPAGLEPVQPLEATANRWTPASIAATSRRNAPSSQLDENSPEVLDRKLKGLLNKLTLERFDSISDQIIEWANRSEKETDGRTLMRVIRHVFEKATDEATWSEMYARLCRKMLEKISSNVVDESIKTTEGKPFSGGQLFRKYLLNRCQEDFERGWMMKEATMAAAAAKAQDDDQQAAKEEQGEEALYSDEYYAAQKAKRQGLGLVKFIGELFKLQMLTERIMHQCIKKLLTNLENPAEEEIESLCKLLSTVGQLLDTSRARNHMDVYFTRMRELSSSPKIAARMQYMLVDVIELRQRGWQTRNVVTAPSTIAAVHEQAAKEKIAAEREAFSGRVPMSRGGSRRGEQVRGGEYGQVNSDGWTTAGGPANAAPPRPLAKAGDLSKFGQIGKSTPATYGPSAVFKSKEIKRESGSLSRTTSNSNMFASLVNSDNAVEPLPSRGSQPPSRKPSGDFTQSGILEGTSTGRRPLKLLPRTVNQDDKDSKEGLDTGDNTPETHSESDDEVEEGEIREDGMMADSLELPPMSAEEADRKIAEDMKELFSVRNLEEADEYFRALPSLHHSDFVDKIVTKVIDMKEADAKFIASFLQRSSDRDLCSPADLEQGCSGTMELLDDISVDAPAAYKLMAIILRGTRLPQDAIERLADKIVVDGDPVTPPRQKLLTEYEKLS